MQVKTKKRGRVKGQDVKEWTFEDKDFLKSFYLILDDKELGQILGRSHKTINTMRYKLGLMKTTRKHNYKKLYQKTPIIIIKPLKDYSSDVLKLTDILN